MTQSFPPADMVITKVREFDYKKHMNNYMDIVETIVVYVAAISTIIWEKFQTIKIMTPEAITNYFYFSVNVRAVPGDEIVGLSVGNRYIGLYNKSLVWGVLDENGALSL